MARQISSYQKLKTSLQFQKGLVRDLKNAIADGNREVLIGVKIAVLHERQTEKLIWFG